ncbi:MAG: glycosyltransferase [Candidatus Manganitrophaceae bacterium]
MKIAIVHDYLNQYGGAEKVVEVLHELYPDAPIFTSIFLPKHLPPHFSTFDIRPSFMQRLPFLDRHFKKYLLLYPSAIERFDLKGFDLVLSSSSAFAKGARPPQGVRHICYCYSPMRFAWDLKTYIEKEQIHSFYKLFLPWTVSRLKNWDIGTLNRVDHFIGISRHIRQKIKMIYQRDADVIYPPVDLSQFFISSTHDDYFLIVSRLNAYKRIDIAIEAFNQLSWPLLIIGKGPQEDTLKKKAKKNVVFLGEVSQRDLPRYLSRCRAFIFPGEEDFGIAPVEAMASGRPVIAYGRGGALETVVDGLTGTFFKRQTTEDLIDAIHRFEKMSFDPQNIRRHAEQFDKEVFKEKIKSYVNEKFQTFR